MGFGAVGDDTTGQHKTVTSGGMAMEQFIGMGGVNVATELKGVGRHREGGEVVIILRNLNRDKR